MKRNKNIDIVKGIGIILMVLGHSGAPFTSFIYLFHMGIFFVLSGICFNSSYSDNVSGIKQLIIKRIKSLWIPYFFINELFLCLHNVFIKVNIYEGAPINLKQFVIQSVKIVLFSAGEQLGGATWFFRVLFLTTILYAFVEFAVKRITKKHLNAFMILISIALLLLGYFLNLNNRSIKLQMGTVFSVFILFEIGVLIRKKNVIEAIKSLKVKLPCLFIISISFILLLIIGKTGENISIVDNKYQNPISYVAATLLGFIMIYYIAELIKTSKKLLNIMSYIGENTVPIILLHFAAFKAYMIILACLNVESITILSKFPIYIGRNYDYIIYAIFGVVLPLIVNELYKKLSKMILPDKVSDKLNN